VEVDAPGVGCAMRDDFEDLPRRVVPPDAAVEEYAVLFGRPRLADVRARLDAIAAVEPAVRPPGEGVEDVVLGLQEVPAVEDADRRAVRLVVAIAVGNEQEVRRAAQPDAAEAEGNPREVGSLVVEDRAPVEAAVAVAVLEDH